MKKIILPLLLLAACGNSNTNVQTKEINNNLLIRRHILEGVRHDIDEVKIDYCEYIIVHNYHGVSIIHKANCANDFHRTTK